MRNESMPLTQMEEVDIPYMILRLETGNRTSDSDK